MGRDQAWVQTGMVSRSSHGRKDCMCSMAAASARGRNLGAWQQANTPPPGGAGKAEGSSWAHGFQEGQSGQEPWDGGSRLGAQN